MVYEIVVWNASWRRRWRLYFSVWRWEKAGWKTMEYCIKSMEYWILCQLHCWYSIYIFMWFYVYLINWFDFVGRKILQMPLPKGTSMSSKMSHFHWGEPHAARIEVWQIRQRVSTKYHKIIQNQQRPFEILRIHLGWFGLIALKNQW